MDVSRHIVENPIFQFFTWFTITSALIINLLAFVVSRQDRILGRMRYHYFLAISFLSGFWMVAYTAYFIDHIDRQQYLNVVSPLAPVAFLVVWVLPPLEYYIQTKHRKL